jgi:phenylacetate-CoA ligase
MVGRVTYAPPELNAMSTEEIRAMQERLLRGQLKYCYENSSFYKQKFDDIGARPEDIKTLDDLRRLPILMTKDDERKSDQESLEKCGHPFGMHLCAPPEDVYLTGTTSGTTGLSTFTYTFTKADLDVLTPCFAYHFSLCGIKRGDRVLFYFALGIYATSMGLWGLRHMGALPIDIDVRAGSELMLKFAELTRPSVLVCTPSLAQYLAEKAPSIIHKDVRDLRLKALKLTGEPWASLPEVKRKIEEQYGCRAYDFYAPCGTGLGVSCDSEEYHGLHAFAPHICTTYQDLVDPMSKKPIDIVDGAVGEIVITTLQRKACPLVRYAYGDIVQISTKECPGCGFKGPRVKIVGRADDMLIVKGSNVYPAAIKKIVTSFMPRVTGEMRIVLDQPPPRVVPPLKLKIEHGEETRDPELDGLAEEISRALHDSLKVRPAIEWVRPGSLEKAMRKAVLFEKRYPTT